MKSIEGVYDGKHHEVGGAWRAAWGKLQAGNIGQVWFEALGGNACSKAGSTKHRNLSHNSFEGCLNGGWGKRGVHSKRRKKFVKEFKPVRDNQ